MRKINDTMNRLAVAAYGQRATQLAACIEPEQAVDV